MKKLLVALVGGVMLFGSAVVFAGVPKGKEVLNLTLIDGKKKEPVVFNHAKHNTEYKKKGGAAIECKDCHHTATSDKDVKKCTDCHVKVGETPKKIDGKDAAALADEKFSTKSIIFHTKCKDGCHKDMKDEGKKITACKTCHAK
jgi:hypothetical protein